MLRSKLRDAGRAAASLVFMVACATVIWFALAAKAHAYKVQVTDSGAKVRWYEAQVELQLSPEIEAYFADMPLPRLMNDAAEAWAGLPGAPIVHVTSGSTDELGFHEQHDGNGVYLVHDWTLFPDALAVTVATFESRTGKLVDADVLVNANFRFALLPGDGKPSDSYDLLSVMTHELGHVLGLGDAPDAPGATMWPTVNPGDTYQRDIDADDEEGVEQAYRSRDGAETLSHSGCGGASVLRQPAPRTHTSHELLAMAALWIALWLWSRARSTRTSNRYGIVLGGALLFGGLFAPSPSAPAEPDHVDQLAPVVDARGSAREQNLEADPDVQQRFGAFIKGAERLIVGRATNTRAQQRSGLIFTQFAVRGAFSSAELEFPGGSLHGLTQVISGQTPPKEGDLLLVALHKHGPHGWAHLREGRLTGGTLDFGSSFAWH